MIRSSVRKISAGLVVCCLFSLALADAGSDYKILFGQDEAKVAASRNTKDAAAFAAKLLTAAKTVGEQKDLQALLCEKAYEFGLKDPSGHQTAADAMKLLGESAPEKKGQTQERLVKLMQSRFAKSAGADRKRLGEELVDLLVSRGDERAEAKAPAEAVALYRQALSIATGIGADQTKEIMDKIKGISSALEAEKKLADLKAKLEADPNNTAIRTTLILSYLGELDNPAQAAKLVSPDLDEKLRTYVPLAAKPLADLEEAACLELAYWYAELAEKAPPAGKGVLLGRAKACGERYLSVHTAQDTARLKGTMLLEKVKKEESGLTAQSIARLPKILALDLGKGATMKLALIPAGKFLMGSPASEKEHQADEGPQHEVIISKPFYMGTSEVTVKQFRAFVKDAGYVTEVEREGRAEVWTGSGFAAKEGISWTNPGFPQTDDHPVVYVSWNDCAQFCQWLSKKTSHAAALPTEAQWEYACRMGSPPTHTTATQDSDWVWENSGVKTHPVCQKKPTRLGLYDMLGNVTEWCADGYGPYSEGQVTDPTGPEAGPGRALRGGSWLSQQIRCRVAVRLQRGPNGPLGHIGFRVVVNVGT